MSARPAFAALLVCGPADGRVYFITNTAQDIVVAADRERGVLATRAEDPWDPVLYRPYLCDLIPGVDRVWAPAGTPPIEINMAVTRHAFKALAETLTP